MSYKSTDTFFSKQKIKTKIKTKIEVAAYNLYLTKNYYSPVMKKFKYTEFCDMKPLDSKKLYCVLLLITFITQNYSFILGMQHDNKIDL